MKVQQSIIVIMLTAVIFIFVGMVTQSQIPDDKNMQITVFGFTVLPWIMIVTVTDLYLQVSSLRQDMNSYMKCN
jgi:hypothetical protein